MAVIVTKEIKKKRIQLATAGGLILVALLIVYFGVFNKSSTVGPTAPSEVTSPVQPTTEVSDIDVKIFDDERFKNLKNPPGVPLATTTEGGKSNPFSD